MWLTGTIQVRYVFFVLWHLTNMGSLAHHKNRQCRIAAHVAEISGWERLKVTSRGVLVTGLSATSESVRLKFWLSKEINLQTIKGYVNGILTLILVTVSKLRPNGLIFVPLGRFWMVFLSCSIHVPHAVDLQELIQRGLIRCYSNFHRTAKRNIP